MSPQFPSWCFFGIMPSRAGGMFPTTERNDTLTKNQSHHANQEIDGAVVRKRDPEIHRRGRGEEEGAALTDCGTTLMQPELTTVTKRPLKQGDEDLIIIPSQTISSLPCTTVYVYAWYVIG